MSKLNSHFLVKTDAAANEENVLVFGDVRVSVLLDGVVRIEKGAFCDEPTQSFIKRNHGKVNFESEKNGNKIVIKTSSAEFCINISSGKPVWARCGELLSKCNNKKNLGGTARTLDRAKGAVKLSEGVVSLDGTAVIDDSKSLCIAQNGEILPRKAESKDIYVFTYGHNYRAAVKALFALTGEVPLIPRYALGNWWSRYHVYTEETYLNLMCEFKKRNIPLTVATVDMDWHWVNVEKEFPEFKAKFDDRYIIFSGWTGYSWNTKLFPDYKRFLNKLHEMGLKTTVNLHPASGVRWYEDMYEDMAKANGIDPESKKRVDFDITDPRFINSYFDVLHHPYEENGVDFWWIDWQQGKKTKVPGLDPLWALNHYHFLDKKRDGKRSLILSRYAGIGSHRYPLGFSGDTIMCWSALDFQPYFTSNATNCGYTWWSHDIGGHCKGIHDSEMYTRWVQLGVFSPILRLHSSANDLSGKEPWKYSKQSENIVTDFLRFRHSLIPYIYTMNYLTHSQGTALCEPIFYTSPENQEAYKSKNTFMFGTEILVSPVTAKCDPKTSAAITEVYLPEGRWTNILNGKIYNGGKTVRVSSFLEEMPVFAKEGAVIPMSEDGGNSARNPEKLKIRIYRGTNEFSLYEDDGETESFKDGEFSKTLICVKEDGNKLEVTLGGAEKKDFMPSKRKYKFEFADIVSAESVKTFVSGKEAEAEVLNADGKVTVVFPHLAIDENIKIVLENTLSLKNPDFKESIINVMSRFDSKNSSRSMTYFPMKKINDRKKLVSHAKRLPNDSLRQQLLEILEDME